MSVPTWRRISNCSGVVWFGGSAVRLAGYVRGDQVVRGAAGLVCFAALTIFLLSGHRLRKLETRAIRQKAEVTEQL
jgi:hypothetical protein